jgi:hypothetical protein
MTTTTQHTVRQLVPALGSTVLVRFEELTIECNVADAKNSWGKVRLLVEPLAGKGQQWIELGRLVTAPRPVVDAPEDMRNRQQAAREVARYNARLYAENRRLHPEDYS